MSETNAAAGPSTFLRGQQPIAPAPPQATHSGKLAAVRVKTQLTWDSLLQQYSALVQFCDSSTHERSDKPLKEGYTPGSRQ